MPPDRKLADIILIFKKAKKEDLRNYRPVSLNSVTDKIMEKIILGSTGKHLEDNTVRGQAHRVVVNGMTSEWGLSLEGFCRAPTSALCSPTS